MNLIYEHKKFKNEHPGMIPLFRVGDYYEAFGDDAKILHRVLGITITTRSAVPMTGIPKHSIERCLGLLIMAGHKPILCETTTQTY